MTLFGILTQNSIKADTQEAHSDHNSTGYVTGNLKESETNHRLDDQCRMTTQNLSKRTWAESVQLQVVSQSEM